MERAVVDLQKGRGMWTKEGCDIRRTSAAMQLYPSVCNNKSSSVFIDIFLFLLSSVINYMSSIGR